MPERNWPVNINENDKILFHNNKYYEIKYPELDSRYFVLFDAYRLLAYPDRDKWQKHSLIFGNLLIKDFTRHKTFFYNKSYFFIDHWSSNYFHWFTEVIPKILWLKKELGIKFIELPNWLYEISFISESLKYITDCEIILIKRSHNRVIKKAYWCNLGMLSGNYNPNILKAVRELYCGKRVDAAKKANKKYFIYRDAKKGRGIVNYDEIKSVLDFFSIEILDFELINWNTQLQLFQDAELLIGVHGAGLTNMLFMTAENAKILELRRGDDNHNNCYYSLADALAIPYYYLKCDVDCAAKTTQQNNFIVDRNKFFEILNTIVNNKDV